MFSALGTAVVLLVTSQGFVRTDGGTDAGNFCLFWPDRVLTYTLNSAGYSGLPDGGAFPPIDAAYATWSGAAAGCSDFNFNKGLLSSSRVIGYDPSNPVNLILFREASCFQLAQPSDPCWTHVDAPDCNDVYDCWQGSDGVIALTTVTFDTTTGEIASASTEFNAAPHQDGTGALVFGVVNASCMPGMSMGNVNDVQATMTHEIGHSIGLAHDLDDPNSTMAPTAPAGNTCKRIVDPGTAAGLCFIYPRAQPTPPCGPLNIKTQQIVQGTTFGGCASAPGDGRLPLAALLLVLAALVRNRR